MALYRSEGTDGPVLSFNRNAVVPGSILWLLQFDSLLAATPSTPVIWETAMNSRTTWQHPIGGQRPRGGAGHRRRW